MNHYQMIMIFMFIKPCAFQKKIFFTGLHKNVWYSDNAYKKFDMSYFKLRPDTEIIALKCDL